MDIEKIKKMYLNKYNTPDNILGKTFLLRERPEIVGKLIREKNSTNEDFYKLTKAAAIELGLDIGSKMHLSFNRESFPELWIDKTEK